MSAYFWESFLLNAGDGEVDEMLELDADGNVYDASENFDYSNHGPDTRWRYRTVLAAHLTPLPWLFLQEISGVWHWWASENMGFDDHTPIPHARTLEEAQAAAIASWRMTS